MYTTFSSARYEDLDMYDFNYEDQVEEIFSLCVRGVSWFLRIEMYLLYQLGPGCERIYNSSKKQAIS